ncbi:hypothetical protein A11A3_00055 [Alcanivorax hongdengensis A-11-3]|uniref:Uncharacterized protein n=1 Tax=Alcanivorax hongdengensis A-11-3 TaxID=1177179 RepID=L0WGJ1_9GAMM|nr:tetratricopeptide repeat protein [Alcanivorax hongdengensis]EKF75839.1 hypothetical protein A11A3_00055 [Alcanivorax hongdengensis A-11-3]
MTMLRLCLLTLALLITSVASARLDQPERIEEPAYGEVVFYYLQGDYFAALTRAQMALERGEVHRHRDDLKVLIGAMYSAYGMPEDAEKVFSQLLSGSVSEPVAKRAWIHLAGLYYRQQKNRQALALLDSKVGTPPEDLKEVYLSLRARILMRLGRYQEAAESLDAFAVNHPLNAYLRYNLAVSWINGEHPSKGQAWLWQLANMPPGNEEVNAVKEKAMLALAIYMLRSDQEERALELLRNARLDGPFSDISLLLYARALLIEQQPRQALPVLQQLDKLSIQRNTVQEAQLALPYLYQELGDEPRAAQAYRDALQRYDDLQQYLVALEGKVAAGSWFRDLVGKPQWTTAMDPLPHFLPKRVESFPTFYEWFASLSFQHGWKNYHELQRQQHLLQQWQGRMPGLQELVAAHQRKHDDVVPRAQALLQDLSDQDLQGRLTRLQRRFDKAVQDQDPVPFATPKERKLWQAAQDAEQHSKDWGERTRPDLQEKLAFAKGVLQWDMQQDIVARQWPRQQTLNALNDLLEKNRQLRSRVLVAASRTPRLAYYHQEIDSLSVMLGGLMQRGQTLLARQQSQLEASAVAQVDATRKRLRAFSAAAYEGLADMQNAALRQRPDTAPSQTGLPGAGGEPPASN